MSTTPPTAGTLPSPIPKLTTRRQILLHELANGKTMAQATASARMAREAGYRAVEEIREQIPELMDDVGLDVRSILCRIREKMDAQETKFFQHEGRVCQTVDVEAHGVQLKAIELAANLRPELASRDSLHVGTVNILWAGPSPAWAGHASADTDAKPNQSLTVDAMVHTDNQSVTAVDSVPQVQLKVLDRDRPPVPTCAVPVSGKGTVLTQRVVKKRGPRLPVLGGRNKR